MTNVQVLLQWNQLLRGTPRYDISQYGMLTLHQAFEQCRYRIGTVKRAKEARGDAMIVVTPGHIYWKKHGSRLRLRTTWTSIARRIF